MISKTNNHNNVSWKVYLAGVAALISIAGFCIVYHQKEHTADKQHLDTHVSLAREERKEITKSVKETNKSVHKIQTVQAVMVEKIDRLLDATTEYASPAP